MAKRFTDTGLNRQPWYRKLKPKLKCAIRFLFDECDSAGVWVIDMETMSYFIGEEVTIEELFSGVNSDKSNRIEKFGRDKIFIPGFIEFQYGQLNENCRPHQKIIALLKKYRVLDRVSNRVSNTLQEEEEDKEEDREKEVEAEKDFGKSENLCENGGIIAEMQDVWKKTFPKYTADRKKDFPALGEILSFICEQAGENFSAGSDQIKILNTFQLIADQVNRENFWRNKPLKAISSNIQEFYNQLKNPINGKDGTGKHNGKNGSKTDGGKLQAIIAERYRNGRQASG